MFCEAFVWIVYVCGFFGLSVCSVSLLIFRFLLWLFFRLTFVVSFGFFLSSFFF